MRSNTAAKGAMHHDAEAEEVCHLPLWQRHIFDFDHSRELSAQDNYSKQQNLIRIAYKSKEQVQKVACQWLNLIYFLEQSWIAYFTFATLKDAPTAD